MEQDFGEIVIGKTLNGYYDAIFSEFKREFAKYIMIESGIQTALLNEEFYANEEKATEEMRSWLKSRGLEEGDGWGFQ